MEDLTLWRKTGGRSGTWERDDTGMRSTSAGPLSAPIARADTSASPAAFAGRMTSTGR